MKIFRSNPVTWVRKLLGNSIGTGVDVYEHLFIFVNFLKLSFCFSPYRFCQDCSAPVYPQKIPSGNMFEPLKIVFELTLPTCSALFPFTSLFCCSTASIACLLYLGSEICLLRELCQHPCVVTLLDVQYATPEVLYMVFEYMDQVRWIGYTSTVLPKKGTVKTRLGSSTKIA